MARSPSAVIHLKPSACAKEAEARVIKESANPVSVFNLDLRLLKLYCFVFGDACTESHSFLKIHTKSVNIHQSHDEIETGYDPSLQ